MNEDDTSNLNIYCDSKNKLVDDSDNVTYIFMDKSCRCYIIGLAQMYHAFLLHLYARLQFLSSLCTMYIQKRRPSLNFTRAMGISIKGKELTYIRLEIK